jgi:hypothetical protein
VICAGFRMRLLSHNPLSTPCPPLLGVYKRRLGDTPKPSAGTRHCTLFRMIRSETGENPKPWQRSAGPSWSGPESSPNSWGIIGNAEGLALLCTPRSVARVKPSLPVTREHCQAPGSILLHHDRVALRARAEIEPRATDALTSSGLREDHGVRQSPGRDQTIADRRYCSSQLLLHGISRCRIILLYS